MNAENMMLGLLVVLVVVGIALFFKKHPAAAAELKADVVKIEDKVKADLPMIKEMTIEVLHTVAVTAMADMEKLRTMAAHKIDLAQTELSIIEARITQARTAIASTVPAADTGSTANATVIQ